MDLVPPGSEGKCPFVPSSCLWMCLLSTYQCAPSPGLGAVWQKDSENQLPAQYSSSPHPLTQHELRSAATKTCVPHKSLAAAASGPKGSLNGKGSGCLFPSCSSTNHHGMAHKGVQIHHSHSLAGHRDVRAGGQLSPYPVERTF